MQDDRLFYLTLAYYNNTCTDEEKQELLNWVDDNGESEKLHTAIERVMAQHIADKSIPTVESEHLFANIMATVQPQLNERKGSIWKPIAIAAATLLIALLTIYFWLSKPVAPDTIAVTEPTIQDIPPGDNRATLTLADGTTIVLDSAATGSLAMQGGTHIIKQADGELAFKIDSYETLPVQRYNVLATPRGGQYHLILQDGSRVWLNAASSLRFPTVFTGNERVVELTGEGYFEVAKNTAMPFKVSVNGTTVEALGTAFNINAYTDEATQSTTLIEGKVKVSNAGGEVILKPGQQASSTGDGKLKTDNVSTDEIIAWKTGVFQFDNADMESIARQLSRWYNVDVKFKNKVGGTFSATIERSVPISKVFKMLEYSGRVNLTIDGNTVIVQVPGNK